MSLERRVRIVLGDINRFVYEMFSACTLLNLSKVVVFEFDSSHMQFPMGTSYPVLASQCNPKSPTSTLSLQHYK